MKKANYHDRNIIIDILYRSFLDNQSVNYICRQDEKKVERVKALMDYSFEICYKYGEVFLSDDLDACALVLYPDQKPTSFKTILLDLKLILNCIGVKNIKKALNRESKIKTVQPKDPMYYLWFIGVEPEKQGSGIGTKFFTEILEHSKKRNRPIYLETSTLRNISWYKQFGFEIYSELDFGYKLFFLRRLIN
ncbi:MAG TPA: GNAT family N-acetyltransferase [Pedobacter sp.]|jgi:ribosomal protein S18 acetylase RimI-like enzyme